jgi:hypothetical protein
VRLTLLPFIVAAFTLAACAGEASAHALRIRCSQQGDQIEVRAEFDDRKPAVNATVTVTGGGQLAAGRTDRQGTWRFPKPPPGEYRVVVEAEEAHRAETTLHITAGGFVEEPAEEYSSAPWLKILIGLVAILAFSAVLLVLTRQRGKPAADAKPPS